MKIRMSSQMLGRPWALLREELERLSSLEIEAQAEAAVSAGVPRAAQGYIAVVPVVGMLTPRETIWTRVFGGTGLDRFAAMLDAAVADPAVKSIVLDVDSPGGYTDGVTEAAHRVFAAREKKRITAVANTLAASAAYWIGAAAHEFIASPSARVGSVGVYALHIDRSEQAAKEGIKPVLVSAGENKADSAETGGLTPLTEEGRAILQEMVDQTYAMMVADIARFRGVTPKTVRDTFGGGRLFLAAEAQKRGLVDRVGTLDQTLERAAARLARQRAQARDREMFSLAPHL